MKRKILSPIFAAACLGMGCHAALGAGAVVPDILASYHFAGLTPGSSQADTTKVKAILGLPQTRALGNDVVQRLARAPQVLFPQSINDAQANRGIPLLRPLINDLLHHESFLDVRGPAGTTPDWLFGVALTPERASLWETNLTQLVTLWKLGPPVNHQENGLPVMTVNTSQARATLRWTQAAGWLVLSVGANSSGEWEKSIARLRESTPPCPPLKEEWLTLELNLSRLAAPLGLPNAPWPFATVRATVREEDVRTQARLVFPEDVTGPIEPWHVPTNIIREPLISFTAWRGARPWLNRCEALTRLGLSPAPNEIYFWAQALSVPQTLMAFPWNDPTNRVRAMVDPLRELIPVSWQKRGLAQLEWREADHQLIWKSLPLLFPHLRGAEDGGRGYITGGSFPALQTTNPPPQELLTQFVGKPGLVYYDWEITARRLAQLRMQVQLSTLIADRALLRTNTPALPWLEEMEQRLGNSATEVVAVSPSEWTLTRRSAMGLTAMEMMGLVCWVESLDFPRFTLRFPEQIQPRAAAPKRKR